jgi:predicted nucleotidyltransferase
LPSKKQPVTLTIALDICANRFNQELFQKKYGQQFKPEDVYFEYQAPGKSCEVERSGVSVEWLVQKFKGVARDLIIAHPFVSESVVMKPLNETDIANLLKIGLTGIEVYHNKTSTKQINSLKKIVRKKAIHHTGGSDSHGKKTDTPLGQYGSDSVIPDFYLSNYNSSHKSRPNTFLIQKVTKVLRDNFKKFKSIQSAYIYGSILTNKFHKKSDIDVLFIAEDVKNRSEFLRKIKAVRATITGVKLDINIVFHGEFRHLWHIFRPPTFFIWVKQRNNLLWGVDSLRDLREKEITAKTIYKRAVDLAQGCRSVYLNDKDVAFWETRYSRWLRELQYGILYLHGELELDSKLCGKKLCKVFPEVKQAELLAKDRLPIKILSEIAETFVLCIYRHFIKKL